MAAAMPRRVCVDMPGTVPWTNPIIDQVPEINGQIVGMCCKRSSTCGDKQPQSLEEEAGRQGTASPRARHLGKATAYGARVGHVGKGTRRCLSADLERRSVHIVDHEANGQHEQRNTPNLWEVSIPPDRVLQGGSAAPILTHPEA